jgi:hypothetical protein
MNVIKQVTWRLVWSTSDNKRKKQLYVSAVGCSYSSSQDWIWTLWPALLCIKPSDPREVRVPVIRELIVQGHTWPQHESQNKEWFLYNVQTTLACSSHLLKHHVLEGGGSEWQTWE